MPCTLSFVLAAVLEQVVFDGNIRQRLTCKYKIKPFCSCLLVECKPAKAIFISQTGGYLERHMCLDKVACVVELRIRINHHRIAAIGGVEDIKMAIGICFKQHTNAIAFLEIVLGISSNREPIRVTHEWRTANAHA